MKLYKKIIKPYVIPPTLQGFNDKTYDIEEYPDWYNEDIEEEIKEDILTRKLIKDSWARLEFQSKFVFVKEE